jgi:glycosyltransferase involved in cell wall biosynthesis
MSDRRPIAFLVHSLTAAGAERKTVTLANGFAARGRDVDICAVETAAPMMRAAIDPRVRLVCLDKRRVRHSLVALARYLRQTRPQVLVCMMRHVAVMAVLARLAARSRTPIVFVEGTFNLAPVRHLAPLTYWRVKREIRLLHRRAQKIVVNSQDLADEFVEHARLPRADISVIPNPAAAPVFADAPTGPHDLPGWPKTDDPIIVTVCRLDANKDVATLLRAFARLRARRPLSLAVIGTGPEEPSLRALAGELGCGADVHFLGVREKPWRYVRKAAVFVLASHHEGFSNALIEALAVGCPVVASDARGGTRFILGDGRYGLLTPPGDAVAMADAVAAMLERPMEAASLVERARQFSESQIDAYLAAVEEVAG